jgi:hypothetical protein
MTRLETTQGAVKLVFEEDGSITLAGKPVAVTYVAGRGLVVLPARNS